MKRVIRSAQDMPKKISIFDFDGMSNEEIDQYLDSLPDGSQILDVCTKPDRHQIDSIIKKVSSYVQNMHNRFGSPNDSKFYETFWTIGGYKDPYFGSTKIRQILDGTSKYYQISPRAVTASNFVGGYPFTSYTGEPYVSPDLWTRCQQNIKTWRDVWSEFESIVDEYFPDEEKISEEISKLYHRNRQSKAYQEAYQRWLDSGESDPDED